MLVVEASPPSISPDFSWFTESTPCFALSNASDFILTDKFTPLLFDDVSTSLVSFLAPNFTSPLFTLTFPWVKLVAVISAPLLRVTLSPNTRLDFAFVKSFSFNLLWDFPYPTEKPPLPMLELKPFFFSSSEYELWSSLESVVSFPFIIELSPRTRLLPTRFTSPFIVPLFST